MKKILFFLTFLFPSSLFAQVFSGQINDAQSREPIPYATLYCAKKMTGTFTDSLGHFVWDVAEESDEIKISCVGYFPLTKKVNELTQEISLQKDSTLLETVTVYGKKFSHTKRFGNFKPYVGLQSVHYNIFALVVAYIENTKEKPGGTLQTAVFKFGRKQNKEVKAFRLRVRVFSDNNGKPDQDLLTKSVVFDVEPTETIKKINILEQNVTFPTGGVWLGAEPLGYIDLENRFIPLKTGYYNKLGKGNLAPFIRCFRTTDDKKIGAMKFSYEKWRSTSNEITVPLFSASVVFD